MVRVLTTQTDAWPRNPEALNALAGARIRPIDSNPPTPEPRQWDAFLEALVAYRFHVAGLPEPTWTKTTSLDPAWWPYEGTMRTDDQLRAVYRTPVEFLHRGVIFDRSDLKVV